MHATVRAWYKMLSLRDITICDFTSWGSHSRLLERAIINIQALCDQTNPSVLWLKYDLNINKNGIFVIQLYFLHFFNDKNDHCTYLNSRKRLLRQSKQLHIDKGTKPQNENLAFILQLNRTEQNRTSNRNSNQPSLLPPFGSQQLVGWLL